GEEELRLMRKGSYVVNTARGAVVDGNALAAALMQGRLGGAALDVLDPEPPEPDDPLLSLDNVILTPHMAGSGERAAVRMAEVAAQGIIDVLSGRRPEHCANPQVLDELGMK
ncbi:MAG: NAD(P)-dependent oxidoreductase, partial [Nitrospinota bacterium]